MKNRFILVFILVITSNLYSQEYKKMMNDNNINFYDVVNEAENYFSTHDKFKKGSGWKPYQRWLFENESKYYPSGIRNNTDPNVGIKEFLKLKRSSVSSRLLLANSWTELGPIKIDTITSKPTAGIGRVEDFYVDSNDTNYMYLSSRSGGLFKTTDGGVNWSPKTDFLFSCGVNNFDVSPTSRNELLINVNNAANQYSNGIYKSIDGGDSWIATSFNPLNISTMGLGQDMLVQKVVYHPLDANVVFVGTNKGLYRSADKLDTSTQIYNNINIIDIAFHPTNENIVYFYERTNEKNKIYISTDKGLTFTLSNEIVGNNNSTNVILRTSPACPDCVYFSSKNGVWKSVNNGLDFTFQSNPTGGNGGFAVGDLDNTLMIRGYVIVQQSTDDGVTFSNVTVSAFGNSNATDTSNNYTKFLTNTDYVHVDLHPAQSVNGVFYIGTDGWLCKSENNGADWTILNQNVQTGTPIRENYRLGVSQSNNYRTITGCQDNGTSIKREEHWVDFITGDGMEGLFHPLNYNWAVGSIQGGGRYRTEDGGYSIAETFRAGGEDGSLAAPILYDPNNQMTLYDFKLSVWKSENFGDLWTEKAANVFSGAIKQAIIAQNNSDIIIVSRNAEIKKSIDGGATFVDISNNLPNLSIKELGIDPNNDDRIFVVYNSYINDGNKVFMSEDGGATWQNITYNLGNMPIRTIVVDHTDASNIYVGSEIGLYTKPLNGTTWTLYNTDLPNVAISDLEIVNGSNTIRATTWGRGTWENKLVGRENYPSIILTETTDLPTNILPIEGTDQYITSTVEYSGTLTNVHVAWSIDNPVFDNTIAMSNSTGDVWVSDNPIPQYPEGTKIYFKVLATGSNNDTTETYKFMYTVKGQPFCEALGGGPYKILNVKIDNSLGATVLDNSSGNSTYTFYSSPITDLTIGDQYTVTVTSNKDTSVVDYGVWVDFDNDHVFNNTNEQIIFQENAGSFTASGAFTVPSNAVTDKLIRMRTRVSKVNLDACGTTNGEVEDYALNFNSSLGIDNYFINNVNITDNINEIVFMSQNNVRLKNISIYNALGQELINKNVNSTFVNLPTQIDKRQFIIVKVLLENGKVVTQKMIKK